MLLKWSGVGPKQRNYPRIRVAFKDVIVWVVVYAYMYYTGLFISPSGISKIDCATTKTDTAERSISMDRESLQVFVQLYSCSLARVVDFWGLLTNASRTRSTVSADGPGRPLLFAAHRQPLCWNFMYHSWIVLSVGGSVWYMIWNLRCTVTIDSIWQIPRHRTLSYSLRTPFFVTTTP